MSVEEAFTRFPELTTARLRLRQIRMEDAEALYAIKSNDEVTRRYGQEPHHTVDDTRAWLRRIQENYDTREALFWLLTVKDQDTVIGSCTLWNIAPGFHHAEIGYELHPDHWGHGLMPEAASAIVTYGFTQLGLRRIEANPLGENVPSQRLLLKLGFTFEGALRQRCYFRGHFQDEHYYGLLKEEWRA